MSVATAFMTMGLMMALPVLVVLAVTALCVVPFVKYTNA